jgi:hypothetical protein
MIRSAPPRLRLPKVSCPVAGWPSPSDRRCTCASADGLPRKAIWMLAGICASYWLCAKDNATSAVGFDLDQGFGGAGVEFAAGAGNAPASRRA